MAEVPPHLKSTVFKKGQSGNPGGKSANMVQALRMSKTQVAELIVKTCQMNLEQAKAYYADPSTPLLDKTFIKMFLDALAKGGDATRAINCILDRTIGKPKENLEINVFRRIVERLDGTRIIYTNDQQEALDVTPKET